MPTQLFVFVYWEKGYTNPIRCQRAWAAHRNSTLKGGAATERDGKGLDALATNFNLLTRLASHYPFALFVGDNHVATRGYALQFEDALLVGPTLTAGAEIIYSGLFENNQRGIGRDRRSGSKRLESVSVFGKRTGYPPLFPLRLACARLRPAHESSAHHLRYSLGR